MEIIIESKSIELLYDSNIDYRLYSNFDKIQLIAKEEIDQVFLNFSKTKYITLPGCIYIIFLLYEIKLHNKYFETRIISITENLIHVLTKFGFFESSSFYCNLKVDKQISDLVYSYNYSNTSSIYWPIATVPPKLDRHFESNNAKFTNGYSEYFDLLIKNKLISSDKYSITEIRSKFNKSIYELVKNIWEHSNSWGLASIQSTDSTNTTIAICDYGIGFIESYKKRNSSYQDNSNNNNKLIESQLEDNFSSKSEHKYGHGMARVKEFVDLMNGILLIKTDKFKVTYNGKTKEQTIENDNFFKGAQIFINF